MTNEDIIEKQQCEALQSMKNTNWLFIQELYKHIAKGRKMNYDAHIEAGWSHADAMYIILNGGQDD